MRERLKDFKDLEVMFGTEIIDYEEGIDKLSAESITGGDSTNIEMNRVFTNRFSAESIKVLVNCFERLKFGNLNSGKISKLISELRVISKEMKVNKEYPMEAILYGSKVINNILKNNDLLVDNLGDFLVEIFDNSPIRNKDAAIYIINNWGWNQQVNIIINTIGKIKDKDLIDEVLLNTVEERRFETFKALVNSSIEIYSNEIIKMLMFLKYGDSTDEKIARYFKNFYVTNFGEGGVETARDFVKLPTLSRRGKLVIESILPKGEEKISVIDLTIGNIKNLVEENSFEQVNKLVALNKQRRNCYIAMRWSKQNDEIMKKWSNILIASLKNNKNNESEIKEGVITLARLGSKELTDIAHKYINKNIAKEHCYGALTIQGNPIYRDKLIEEIFNMNFVAYRVLGYCKNKVINEVCDKIWEYLNSNNRKLLSVALIVSTELTVKNMLDFPVYFPKIIKNLLESKSILINDEAVRMEIIKSIEQIFDETTKNALVPSLFLINEDERSSIKEKMIARKLLLSIGAELPK